MPVKGMSSVWYPVTDVDAEVQDGGEVRIFTVYDPDGNAVELVEGKG